MLRNAAAVLTGLLLAGTAAAQTRVAPVEIRIAVPTAGLAAPAALTASPLAAAPALIAAPSLSIAAPAAALAAAPAAALPALAAPAIPAAEAAAVPTTALGAASAMLPVQNESSAASDAKAAASFDGGRPLNVLMVGAEAVPFIKTGGLADVVDAVARGLAERGHKVMMVLPKYRQLKLDGIELKPAGEVSVVVGAKKDTAILHRATVNGVDVVLIDHNPHFDRPQGPYEGNGSVYTQDGNDERFAFFSAAALEAARALDFRPDVAHAHDWHAALVPAFLKLIHGSDPFFSATASVLTIHNIAYQGVYPISSARKFGFDAYWTLPMAPLEFYGHVNFLKAGVQTADAVTTVSPTYAKEILTPKFSEGLDGVLNHRPDGVTGVLNGIDPALTDPRTDAHISRNYGVEDVAQGKAENKAWLQKRLGLEEKPDAPLFAVASRLAHQKGIDLVIASIDELVARGAQVVITGSGDKPLEKALAEAVARHPGSVASHPFHETFVHAVYAAADFLLMPSRFEPCGLSQLIAHRYGTLPIVTRTGGLADTVRDLRDDAERGDGIFIRDFTVLALVEAAEAAIAGYNRPDALSAARATAMSNDASWGPALDAYEALYRRLTGADAASRSASAAPASGASASSTSSASDARRDGSTAE